LYTLNTKIDKWLLVRVMKISSFVVCIACSNDFHCWQREACHLSIAIEDK
jgi:hypothetical protein